VTAIALPPYIEARGDSFRVRFPKSILESRWLGTYDTLDEAVQARDAKLRDHYGMATPSPVKESRPPLPVQDDVDFTQIDIPDNTKRQFALPMIIPSTDILVMGDLHVPQHNKQMLKRAIYVTRRYFPNVSRLCLIGDTWDWTSLSKHPKDQPSEDLDESLELGGEMIRHIADYFDSVWMTNGNHDARLGLKLDAPFTLKRVVAAALAENWPKAKLHVSNLDYVYADNEDKDPSRNWILGHPSHYSGMGGKTPSEIADTECRNVATGHNHRVGLQPSKSGKFVGVDCGHMTDPDLHYYVLRRLTKFARWTGGFLVLSQGYPHLYTEQWTDWAALGCK
jgi:hypothetical protein